MMHYLADMRRRYREGDLPWDAPLPPPEVLAATERLPPGRALDLGCGSGRACIALAQRGWRCTGVDVVPEAIILAEARAAAAGVTAQISFHVSSVARLDMLQPPYDLAIDVGCLHSLDDPEARAYTAGLVRLLRPGASYLLFGRRPDPTVVDGLRGLSETRIRALFAGSFHVDQAAPGMTTNAVGRTVPSLWLWLTRC